MRNITTEENIKKDYVWNTIGVFAQNAISPLLLIVVTRINGIFDSGLFSFAFSVAIIFWVIGMWGGRTYQVSDVTKEFTQHSYLMVRLMLTVVMLVGAYIFALSNHYDAAKTTIIIALVLFKAVESVADAIHGVLQVHGRLYVVGRALFLKAITGFVIFTVIDVLTSNILLSVLGIVVINVLITLTYDLHIAGKFTKLKYETMDHLTRTVHDALSIMTRTWPVFIVVFLSMFSLNIPRYFVDLYHEEQVGYFGILAMPITLIALVMTFILQPKVVYLSEVFKNKDFIAFNQTIKRLMGITAVVGIFILLVAYIVGIPVLNIVFGTDFSSYQVSLLVIVVGGIINALVSIFINIFTIMRHFKYQFYILLITNIFLVFLSATLIGQYGLLGGVSLFTMINLLQLFMLIAAYRVTLLKIASPVRK